MPAANLQIFENHPARTVTLDGISIRSDILFANEKGEEKDSVEKRSTKTLQKLSAPLRRIMRPDETVLQVMQARSPLSVLEQLTAAWWTSLLAACVIVVTNRRILFLPVKHDGSWRESVRAVNWGDLEAVKVKGLLICNVSFELRNGPKITYMNFRRAEAKKFAAIASAMIPAASGEGTAASGFAQLCPDCCGVLTPGKYGCPQCSLSFKNEKTMIMRSIFLPGGGYFYTGHPLIAILPAVVEIFLLLEILLIVVAGVSQPGALQGLLGLLLIMGIFWTLETGITILHCRRYIRNFIPDRRNSARVPQGGTPYPGV